MGAAGHHVSVSKAGSLGIISIDGMADIEAHHSRGHWQAHVAEQLYRERTLGQLGRTIRDSLTHRRRDHRTAAKAGHGHRTANRYDRVRERIEAATRTADQKAGDILARPTDSHPTIDARIERIEPATAPPNRYDRAHPQPPPPPGQDD
jgi:hypothetical protein